MHKSGISLQAFKWSSSSPAYFLLKHIAGSAARELETISGVNLGLKVLYLGKLSRVPTDTPRQTIVARRGSWEIRNLLILGCNLLNSTRAHVYVCVCVSVYIYISI